MLSYSSVLLQLIPVASAYGHVAIETSATPSTQPISALIADGFRIWFDDAICDAFLEGILALTVFGIASTILKWYRRYTSKPSKAKRASSLGHKNSTKPSHCYTSVKNVHVKHEAGGICSANLSSSRGVVQKPCKEVMPHASLTEVSEKTALTSAGLASKRVKQTDADSIVAAIRSGKASQLNSLLDSAYSRAAAATGNDPIALDNVSCDLLLASLRACASSRCFNEALLAYDHMEARIGDGSNELWSVLLYNITEAGAFGRCKHIFGKLCLGSCPSGHDLVNVLRCYIGSQDLVGLREALGELCSAGHSISAFTLNRALAACGVSAVSVDLAEELVASGVCPEGLDGVGYNSLMKCNARASRLDRCLDLRAEMIAKGHELSEITYGILLDACVGAKELDHARKVFEDLCNSGLQVNVVHCTTFIKALVGAGHLDEASRVLQEMSFSTGVKPDLIAYSTIVKAHSENGNVSSALKVLEDMMQCGVKPDEIIFNSVLSGCSVFPLKSRAVLRTYNALIGQGMTPTTTTLSIVLKGFMLSDAYDLSLQVLEEASTKFGLVLQPRLYMQLARACIKARCSKGLLRTFDAMLLAAKVRGETVDPSDVSVLVRNCVLVGEFRGAADLGLAAQKAGIALEPQAQRLLNTAAAKRNRVGANVA